MVTGHLFFSSDFAKAVIAVLSFFFSSFFYTVRRIKSFYNMLWQSKGCLAIRHKNSFFWSHFISCHPISVQWLGCTPFHSPFNSSSWCETMIAAFSKLNIRTRTYGIQKKDSCKYCMYCFFNTKLDQVADGIRDFRPHLELKAFLNVILRIITARKSHGHRHCA